MLYLILKINVVLVSKSYQPNMNIYYSNGSFIITSSKLLLSRTFRICKKVFKYYLLLLIYIMWVKSGKASQFYKLIQFRLKNIRHFLTNIWPLHTKPIYIILVIWDCKSFDKSYYKDTQFSILSKRFKVIWLDRHRIEIHHHLTSLHFPS